MKKLIFILFVCSLFADTINYTYQGEPDATKTEVDNKPIPLNEIRWDYFGGGFILLSGFLLMKTTKECEDCEGSHLSTSEALDNIQSHINTIERQQKLAYMSLIGGGLCLLLDSHHKKVEPSNQALNFNLQPTYQGANFTMSYTFD